MIPKSKVVQRHYDTFQELKYPKEPKLNLRKVPEVKENETPKQFKNRLEIIDFNNRRKVKYKVDKAQYEREVNRIKGLKGVHLVDGYALFGSSHRVSRIPLNESEFIAEHEADTDYIEKFIRIFKNQYKSDSNPSPGWEVGRLIDFFFAIYKELPTAKIDIDKGAVLTVSQTYPNTGSPLVQAKWKLNKAHSIEHEEMSFALDTKYLYDMLRFAKQLGVKELTLHFVSSVYPLYFTDGEGFEYIITPIRTAR